MKKNLLFFTVILFSKLMSAQSIQYHDINPDTTVSSWDAYNFQLGTSTGGLDGIVVIWFHPFNPNEVVVQTFAGTEILLDDTLPAALAHGDTISSNGTWIVADYKILYKGNLGNWQNVADKYLGIRFKQNNVFHYAWLRMDIDQGPTYFKVKDYAYNTVSGQFIKAGATSALSVQSVRKENDYQVLQNGRSVQIIGLKESAADFMIIDMTGKTILHSRLDEQNKTELNDIRPGMYLMLLNGKDTQITEKIILR